MKFTILINISSILSYINYIQCQCVIDIRTDLNRSSTGTYREPVFLKFIDNEYRLMVPTNGELLFRENENAFISCTSDGKPNSLTFNGKQSSAIICISGKKFNINNQQYVASDFNECANAITGNVMNLNKACGIDGILLNIGFNNERGFAKLIEICYSKKRATPIYTLHTIHGKTIKNAMKASTRPSSFKTAEVPINVSPASSFTKVKQLERFTEILGSRDKAEAYLNQTYLARGHLCPDGDMIFFSHQFATYYYINVVGQFQSINNGNWKQIESFARTKAANSNKDLLVFTGVYEVLRLNNKKISLSNKGLEVPKWTWKILKDEESNSGIAFVTLNNPFAKRINNLCNDVCTESGWDWKDRKVIMKGYTICCNISDLMAINDAIPNAARVNYLLHK